MPLRVLADEEPEVTTVTAHITGAAGTFDRDTSFISLGNNCYGYDTPGFKRKQRLGHLVPHTEWYKFEAQKMVLNPGTYHTQWVSNPNTWVNISNCLEFVPTSFSPPYPNMDDIEYLVQSAAAEIYSNGWDALTFSKELPKTARMVTQIGAKARNLCQGLTPRKIAQAWLEGRYGWRTLLYDVQDLQSAVTEFDAERKLWSEKQGYSTLSTDNKVELLQEQQNMKYTLTQSIEYDDSVRGSVSAIADIARFRLNPVETAWEVVPFSFVIDWVWDVGTAIRAASLASVATDLTASHGFKRTYRARWEVEHYADLDNRQAGQMSGSCEWSGSFEMRQPSTLSIRPQVTNKLDPAKYLDLAALSIVRRQLSSRR